MKISEGKKKDLILEHIIANPGASSKEIKEKLFPEHSIEDITILLKEIEMTNPELIKFYFGVTTTYATKVLFAKPFLKKGGFEKIEQEEGIQKRKYNFDFKLSKFKYYTFWPIFIFAFIGFGLSLYNFINNLSPSEKTKQQEQRIEKMESELNKLQTYILEQKNLDSLVYSKDLSEIGNK